MACLHPKDRQAQLGTEPHPVVGTITVVRCLDCGRESRRVRIFEETVADLDLKRFKTRAQFMCRDALALGLIERPQACERCGEAADVDAHHYDYARPLEVEWLCRPCHATADVERRTSERIPAA